MPSRNKIGLPPGSLVFTGEKMTEDTHLKLVQYNESIYNAQRISNGLLDIKIDPAMVPWLAVRGLHDVKLIEEIARYFNIHPLALEDILDTSQRPKLDEYATGVFLIVRSVQFD